jgi:two-component sensor histidine kinase/succinate dehydrogenase hydrophobic anchor subunit
VLGFMALAAHLALQSPFGGAIRVSPGKLGGAMALSMAGASVLLSRNKPRRGAYNSLVTAIILISLTCLFMDAFGAINRPPQPAAGAQTDSRWMDPAAALLSLVVGISLALMSGRNSKGRLASQSIFIFVLLFSVATLGASLVTQAGGTHARTEKVITVATAMGFILLSMAALCAHPNRGGMRIIIADAVGGQVARRLLPAAVLSPIILCVLCYVGYQAKLYEAKLGLIVLTTLNSAVLTTVVWRVARELNEADARRTAAEAERNALNQRLQRAMTETHHRVRNNLQIICALADMQVISGDETVPVSEVKRISSQVQALAAVHDILTRESKADAAADTVSASEVLTSLAGLLQQTVSGRAIRVSADDSRITGRQASAVVVVANELILNALKNSESDVEVEFRIVEGAARLVVRDGGAGFPDGFEPARDANTGLELVQQVSTWDLQGSVRFDNLQGGGGCVTVEIPMDAAAPCAAAV